MLRAEFAVEFVSLPAENEEAFWCAIRWFAEVLREEMEKETGHAGDMSLWTEGEDGSPVEESI